MGVSLRPENRNRKVDGEKNNHLHSTHSYSMYIYTQYNHEIRTGITALGVLFHCASTLENIGERMKVIRHVEEAKKSEWHRGGEAVTSCMHSQSRRRTWALSLCRSNVELLCLCPFPLTSLVVLRQCAICCQIARRTVSHKTVISQQNARLIFCILL